MNNLRSIPLNQIDAPVIVCTVYNGVECQLFGVRGVTGLIVPYTNMSIRSKVQELTKRTVQLLQPGQQPGGRPHINRGNR